MTWPVILFVVLLIALLGSAPFWPYSRAWGPYPSIVLLVATVLVGLKVFGAM